MLSCGHGDIPIIIASVITALAICTLLLIACSLPFAVTYLFLAWMVGA